MGCKKLNTNFLKVTIANNEHNGNISPEQLGYDLKILLFSFVFSCSSPIKLINRTEIKHIKITDNNLLTALEEYSKKDNLEEAVIN